jgi:hypothetical protein
VQLTGTGYLSLAEVQVFAKYGWDRPKRVPEEMSRDFIIVSVVCN